MDLGSIIIQAQQPAPAARTSAPDVDAPAWAERITRDVQALRTLAAFNAARTGLPKAGAAGAIAPSKALASVMKAPALVAPMSPEPFELARLARKAADNAGRMQARGKAQSKAYAGQQWHHHAMPGVLATLKAQGAALDEKPSAGEPGDVFVSMMTPEKATGAAITLPDTTIDVRSIAVLIFTPEGMGKLIVSLAPDAGFRALVAAFVAAADAAGDDLAGAIRNVQAQAGTIESAARESVTA